MGKRDREKSLDWFHRMDGALTWHVVPPDLWSPYSPLLPTYILQELAYNKDSLRMTIDVQCFCDGFEVLRVKNLRNPIIVTDHPCLTTLQIEALQAFWDSQGISGQILQELDRIQAKLREDLDSRDPHSGERLSLLKKIEKKEDTKLRNTPSEANTSAARIMKK